MPEPPTTNHPRPTVLIVSNGYGEDAVGNALARELSPRARVRAYPLVGLGSAYDGVELLDPRKVLPSGGFGVRGTWRGLWGDLRSGGLRFWVQQRQTLRKERGNHDLVIAIGDVYCLWIAAHAGASAVLVATAKSQYNEPHRWFEKKLMRRLAVRVFARDSVTADALAAAGIPVKHVGNPLMDTIMVSGDPLPLHPGRPTVTLLPGSRPDAVANIPDLLKLCEAAGREITANFVCALAPGLELENVFEAAEDAGWTGANGILRSGETEVLLTRSFGKAVQASDVIVGLAGTGNEQAAGLGKPVIAFPGQGSQYSTRFMLLQKRLLGDALVARSSWQEAAESVLILLNDPVERSRRGEVGRQRMGTPGAVRKIAEEIISLVGDVRG